MTARTLTWSLIASALASLAYVAWLRARAREKSADADDLEALHAIADKRHPDLTDRRAMAAWRRLFVAGMFVEGEGGYYLTARGWARIGRSLSEDELSVLRTLGTSMLHGLPGDRSSTALLRLHARGLIDGKVELAVAGYTWGLWRITPAGRVVLGGEVPS